MSMDTGATAPQAGPPEPVSGPGTDERLARVGFARRLLVRPELGSVIGALVVLGFFSWQSADFRSMSGVANWLDPASMTGIMAVAVALLMIGGEFDLSAGVLTGSVGLVVAILATEWGWSIWAAIAGALVFALLVGLVNGTIVVTTKLPSFIVTLAMFLMLQGLNLGVAKAVTDTVEVTGVADTPGFDIARDIFASTLTIGGYEIEVASYIFEIQRGEFRVAILWWIGVTALATWVLLRTRAGNWIFSVGGNPQAARGVGVPVARTKIALFLTTAFAAWLVGVIGVLRLTSAQATAGIGEELQFIAAAVIGGCLLTGGYGSAIGAAIGALIFGMAELGIVFMGWDQDWFMLFLGAMLLLATLANVLVRKYAEEVRR